MKRKTPLLLFVSSFVVVSLACALPIPGGGQPDTSALETAAFETAQSISTQAAIGTVAAQATAISGPTATVAVTILPHGPTDTPQPSPTPEPTFTETASPTITLTPTETPIPLPCDAAGFVADVTVPDGAGFLPNRKFTKTWRLQNVGVCVWTPEYNLVFAGGNLMQGPTAVALNTFVPPGGVIDISADMVSPADLGSYSANWLLRNANGQTFGIGANSQNPFTVNITVAMTLSRTPTRTRIPTRTSTPKPGTVSPTSVIPTVPITPLADNPLQSATPTLQGAVTVVPTVQGVTVIPISSGTPLSATNTSVTATLQTPMVTLATTPLFSETTMMPQPTTASPTVTLTSQPGVVPTVAITSYVTPGTSDTMTATPISSGEAPALTATVTATALTPTGTLAAATTQTTATSTPTAAASATAQTGTPSVTSTSGWLALVNEIRQKANVPAVVEDGTLSSNCVEHARYMAENNDLTHSQNSTLPFASPAGQICAANGNAWLGGAAPAQSWTELNAMDGWMRSVGHRLWLLYPTTSAFGFGFYTASNNRSAAALDILSRTNFSTDATFIGWPVKYPAPGQTGVPAESYPITLLWPYFGPDPVITTVTLTAQDGKLVDHSATTGLPANHRGIQILPTAPLVDNTVYTVLAEGTYNGQAFSYTWKFSTGDTPIP